MEDYLNGLDEELWNCISGNLNPPSNVQSVGASSASSGVENQNERMKKLEKRFMREMRGALPLVVYNYVRSCKTAKEIWNNLKEKFQGSDKTRSFDTSTLNNVYNQLKSHKNEVNEIVEDTKTSLGGPLALVSKMNEKEVHEKSDSDAEEGFIMNSDDEAIAFYSNNRVRKFFKKAFNSKIKSYEIKGSFVNKIANDEKRKEEKKDVKPVEGKILNFDPNFAGVTKIEKKLKGDDGVDCHYCNGANHLANDYMLRKKDEKKNKVKDEAYYDERLKEVRAKARNLSLVAMGEQDNNGT
ncbi:hypothetical protein Lser_V15G05372 [Lactuca serriola]